MSHTHGIRRISWVSVISVALLALTVMSGCQPGQHRSGSRAFGKEAIRAIWVTRWDYKTARDIEHVMDNCRRAGFNTVLFQVRGAGTVFYRSRLEPWADELGGRDPGFDPLSVACAAAHRRGLKIHAWVNVVPGFRGKKPPSNPRQLYRARADWFWRDKLGRRQPLGWYCSLNVCYPEVRRYLSDVMREIVAGYPVDGLHMDYIRFPNEHNPSYPAGAVVPDYPRDARTLAMFRRATGKTPGQAPAAWNAWRTAQVTQLVRDIRDMMRRVRPDAMLTAAVSANMTKAKRYHFQDASTWLAQGLIDAAFPMNYASSTAVFEKQLRLWLSLTSPQPIVTGVMFDKRDPSLVVDQVQRASIRGHHFAAFAYNSLFERLDEHGQPMRDEQSALRAALRRRVIPVVRRLASDRNGGGSARTTLAAAPHSFRT